MQPHKESTPVKSSGNEDSKFRAQLNQVYQAFYKRPMTMKEADVATGVMRENICWYVRALRKANRIAVIRKRACSITHHLAGEWTTDESLFPKQPKQMGLWDQY